MSVSRGKSNAGLTSISLYGSCVESGILIVLLVSPAADNEVISVVVKQRGDDEPSLNENTNDAGVRLVNYSRPLKRHVNKQVKHQNVLLVCRLKHCHVNSAVCNCLSDIWIRKRMRERQTAVQLVARRSSQQSESEIAFQPKINQLLSFSLSIHYTDSRLSADVYHSNRWNPVH